MKKLQIITACIILTAGILVFFSYSPNHKKVTGSFFKVDTLLIPKGKFGDAVRYGRELIINTAFYIGPEGINGKFLGNKMNCTNCHQDAGTKPFSFNLMMSHEQYPQYRAREGKVLSLADRINNCVERPHNGKPLPLDSKEMIAILSYLKWINSTVPKTGTLQGIKNLEVVFPQTAANTDNGSKLFVLHCQTCHNANGEGQLRPDNITYAYPPLWGEKAYQGGSSMHRVIKMAQWLKANMPYNKATADNPFLTDDEALDLSAFINDDLIHKRPFVKSFDYPNPNEKAIDYDIAPFTDSFSVMQHKFGPYPPIIALLKRKGIKPIY